MDQKTSSYIQFLLLIAMNMVASSQTSSSMAGLLPTAAYGM